MNAYTVQDIQSNYKLESYKNPSPYGQETGLPPKSQQ